MEPSFPHPCLPESKVYIIFDACHMLKLMRNTLAEKGVLTDGDGNQIRWQYIKDLFELQDKEGLKAANKLKRNHIEWFQQKMKLSLAAQALSSSVADSLEFVSKDLQLKQFADVDATVKFIRLIDRLFDVLNSKLVFAKGYKAVLRTSNEHYWRPFLLEAKNYLLQLKLADVSLHSTPRKTSVLGFVATITSILDLYDSYVKTGLMSYLATYRLSQDHIELTFNVIRSRGRWNNNPTCGQFRSAYRHLLLKHDVTPSSTGNAVSQENMKFLSVMQSFYSSKQDSTVSCADLLSSFGLHSNDILDGLPGCTNILDDILIFGRDTADHDAKLRQVLQRLEKHNATVRPDKCQIGKLEVDFNGHRISAEGIRPLQSNVEGLLGIPTPTNQKQLTRFICTAAYYLKFVPGFASLCEPLRQLLRPEVPWNWTAACQKNFAEIKAKIANPPILAHFRPEAETIVCCDASSTALGAALSQRIEGTERNIGHFKHSVKAVKRKHNNETDAGIQLQVRQLMALPFLPAVVIRNTFNLLQAASDPRLGALFQYFINQWLVTTPVAMWCIADMDVRTNNALEGWHRRLNGLLGRHHPNIWQCICMLQQEQAASEVTIQQILAGHVVNRRRVAYRECDRRIHRLRDRYQHGTITAIDFISGMAHNLAAY
jgi:hypothetical protein